MEKAGFAQDTGWGEGVICGGLHYSVHTPNHLVDGALDVVPSLLQLAVQPAVRVARRPSHHNLHPRGMCYA
jgi:hypothetical protein